MTDTSPSQEQIDDFNAAAARYSQESGIPLEDVLNADGTVARQGAKTQLGNLLTNMVERPLETEIFFLKARLDDVEPVLEVVDAVQVEVSNHEARIAHLEEVGGGVVVGP